MWERVWVQIRSRPPCIIDATKTKAHTDVESIDDPFLKWQAMANNTVDAYAKQALLDWNPTFAKASSHYAISAEKQEFLIEYCNFVKHMASKVTDSPIKIQPDAIIDFTTRIPVGPFFIHNVPQACPENWPFGEFFWNRLSSWAQLLQWSNVESRPTAMLELYIDFALYTKTIVPLPVKPKEKNQPNANIILLIRTWNMLKLSLNFHSKVLLGTVLLTGPVTTSVLSSLVNGSRNQAP